MFRGLGLDIIEGLYFNIMDLFGWFVFGFENIDVLKGYLIVYLDVIYCFVVMFGMGVVLGCIFGFLRMMEG